MTGHERPYLLRLAAEAQTRAQLKAEPSLRPVLVVLHQESSTPGRIRNALHALGYTLDVRRPRFGDVLPQTLDEHAGAVILGGPMSANDGDDYVRREIDWIEVPLREQRPFLGICLGAQMLAKHLGAEVAPHAQGLATTRSDRPRRDARFSPTGRRMSITGIARASSCPPAPSCWPMATIFRIRRFAPDAPSVSSFIPT